MDRSQKAESVAALKAVFNEVSVVVVTRNLGLSVGQSTDLRTKMRDAGASYKVAKNRLAKLAIKDTPYSGLEEYLTGPTALAWSTDPVAAAKAAVDFAKTNDKLEIVGGAMGATVLDAMGLVEGGRAIRIEGPSGGVLEARITERREADGAPAVLVDIAGTAWLIGEQTWYWDDDDPLGAGFVM